ncbi:hypothetical protein HYH03_006376 [Edaphochlamys debaryana]|uniref:Uncharacterized protein n=1 Tax=Edaphochlamys debaryana TaxID=47281 RepID=A0A836C1E0_9CHLO|nr:hypothetical protein HYH03_006376 [Edaphochlamys debaryana]|eukprot:KAG2495429.1 hypothetical protein HYH03_006376 [Edaphochlamys debaryana]
MVEAGFHLAGDGRASKGDAKYVPPKDWNGMYLDQWIFEYTTPGKANKFTLHCSLQNKSKRMYIHASEDSNPTNVCVLGLQLDNYVPNPALLKAGWTAAAGDAGDAAGNGGSFAVVHCLKMKSLFTEYVITPLLANAEEQQVAPAGDEGAGGALAGMGAAAREGWAAWLSSRQGTVAMAAGAAAVAVGVVLVLRYRAKRLR